MYAKVPQNLGLVFSTSQMDIKQFTFNLQFKRFYKLENQIQDQERCKKLSMFHVIHWLNTLL